MNNFYKNILPSQGIYCVTSIGRNGFARNLFAESIDALLSIIESASQGGNNVFFAVSSFKGHSRKADNAAYTRSFFIDLDVGDGKGYSSKDEALSALDTFITANELPPPVVVDSGNGVHAYWAFDDDIATPEWKVYAEKFKKFCLDKGLHIDPAVTADAARVLRCPDTYNHKNTPPTPTQILSQFDSAYSFDSFVEYLGKEEPTGLAALGILPGLDADTSAIARKEDDNFEYVFAELAVNSLHGSGCNQIKYILENARTLPEPLWYAGLSVASRCVDADTAIHDMSIDYEGYSREETIRKSEQSLREATWAHGCDAFNRLNPGACQTCPFRGQVTSPIRLARKLKEAYAQESCEADEVREEANSEKIPESLKLPADLFPFVRAAGGSIFYVPPPKEDKDGNKKQDDPICVFPHDVYPLKRVKGGQDGDCLIVRAVTPKDPLQEFVLPIRSIYIQDEMKKRLPDNGVYPTTYAVRQGYVSDYFLKWATYLQNKETADIMRGQMGWTEDKSTFVIGNSEILEDGTLRATAAAPSIRNVSKLVHTAGTYETWKKQAAYLNTPGWEIHAFGMLCGFGSPLMSFTPISGLTVCFMSPESGTGKSGTLYAGLSLFSKPHESSVLEGASTDNAYVGRYLAFKNLMFGVDEVSNIGPEKLSTLIHRISQGKAKLRMQSSINSEREIEQSAAMIAFFTSNKDLYELLRTFKGSPDGEMARLMQFNIRKPHEMNLDSAFGRAVFDPFNHNYGHAGPLFIRYLYSRGLSHVKSVVDRWLIRVEKDMGGDSAYRHYVAGIAASFAGGELAAEGDIIHYDLERIYNALMVEVMQLRDSTVKLNQIDYKSLLSDFVHEYHSGFLVLDNDRVVSEPRNTALVGRIEVHNSVQYISKKEFKSFLAKLQISAAEFEKAMKRDGLLVESKKCRLSTGWKEGMITPPIAVYAFKADSLDEVLAKVNVA
jgi:hypothetical protein